nr:putative reverse transcriptase, RNA-dependent DNA polymerase [Tanacetum cinerariifolium]
MANIAEGNLSNNAKAFAVRLCSEEIPSSFEQALKSEKWKKAMDDEMKALKKNKTWDQCALPQGKKPVGCRWIFTVKYKPDGTVERYKAQLVAKGHTQTYGIDLRNLQPSGKNGYNKDHTLFHKNRKNHVTCLIIYVDNMVITGNDEEEIKKLKEGLFAEFEMKDLGNLKYFLRIEVLRSPKGIFICQKKNILDLLTEIRMINCKLADTPMMVNQKLFMEKKAKLVDRNRYQRLVEKLIYFSHTRPDIAHAVGVVSRFMHQPHVAHMNAALRIVRYLKGTASHGVLFRSNGYMNIQMYTDAVWARDKGNR